MNPDGAHDFDPNGFWHGIERFGSRIAAIDDRGTGIAYDALAARADGLAALIGAERQLVLLECENSIDWLVAYLACLRGGHPVMLVAPGASGPGEALTRQFGPTVTLSAIEGFKPRRNADVAPAPLHPELGVMLSTSGSTGSAKCVRLSRTNLAANAASIARYLELDRDERGTANLPTHYSYGLSIVNSHLHAGATTLLTARSVIDPAFWPFLAEHRATSFAGVPHVYELLEAAGFPNHAPTSLRYFTQAGGRLATDAIRRLGDIATAQGWRFYVMYGQTEATARIAYLPPDQLATEAGKIGRAIPGGRLELVDADQRVIDAPDTDGELVYYGPNVMMGYASGREELDLPPGPDRLTTGDIARRDGNGLYTITGRLNRFIKLFGTRIGLDDVERLASEAGHEVAAGGTDDRLLLLTRDSAAAPAITELVAARLKLPTSHIETRAVDDYPRHATGKIDYAAVNVLAAAAAPPAPSATSGPASADPSMTPREREIAAIWEAALGVRGIGRDESFFDIGGDSLSIINVALRMESAGIAPEIAQGIFEGQTIAEIAAGGRSADAPMPTRALTANAVNITRGVLVLIVMLAHWSPFFLERMGSVGLALTEGIRPLLRFGTPGFAIVFGIGLAFFYAPLMTKAPERLRDRLRTGTLVVGGGVALIAAAMAIQAIVVRGTLTHIWAAVLFYNVMLFYLLMMLTAWPILWIVKALGAPVRTALALAVACYFMTAWLRTIWPYTPSEGLFDLVHLMTVARYGYFVMLGYVACGLAIGFWIDRTPMRPHTVALAALCGGAVVAGDIAWSVISNSTAIWWTDTSENPIVIAYPGAALLIFALAAAALLTRSRSPFAIFPLRLLQVTGMLAIAIYVGHTPVIPAKDGLVAIGVNYGLAMILAVSLFAIPLGIAMVRLYRLNFGGGRSVSVLEEGIGTPI